MALTYLQLPFSPVTVVQVIDFSFCQGLVSNTSFHLALAITTLGMILGIMLLMLAVITTFKESVVLYKVTKQWQPNRYMQLFVKDGILYFVAYVSLSPFIHYHSLPSHSLTHITLNYLEKQLTMDF